MKCKKCGKELEKEWNYCPYCGNQIGFKLKVPKFFSSSNNPDSDMDRMGKTMEQMLKSFGFPVKINVKHHRKPKMKKIKHKKIPQKKIKTKKRNVEKREEPKTEIKTMPNKIIVDVSLPDVKSTKDIEMNLLEESLEIRAYSGKKMYFKVIPTQKNSKIAEKKFEKGKLKLVLSR